MQKQVLIPIAFHGEAKIQPISTLPEGVKIQKHTGDLIIAASETVGHHHRIYCEEKEAQLYERDGVLYLKVDSPVNITCRGKHDAITLAPGAYKIGAQREWDYLGQMARMVAD